MSFRKERKFRVTAHDSRALKSQLLGLGMVGLHPDRKITSQYFDTPELRAFEESEEGVLPRFKIRVRWYNDDQNILTLERKISSIEGRFKTSEVVSSEIFDRMMQKGRLDEAYGVVFPSVMISYRRAYFSFGDVRITFDRDIRYIFAPGTMIFRDFEEVIEVKAPAHTPDDYLEKLVPIPSSRFSKYGRSFLHRGRAI